MAYIIREEENGEARCLQCGNELSYGRSDRKFCCLDCKNKYHYVTQRDRRIIRRRVNSSLERNYEILSSRLEAGEDEMSLMAAESLGFTPGNMTSAKKSGARIEYSCYDIFYKISPTRIYSIYRLKADGTAAKK